MGIFQLYDENIFHEKEEKAPRSKGNDKKCIFCHLKLLITDGPQEVGMRYIGGKKQARRDVKRHIST